jgi:hypothetical protein
MRTTTKTTTIGGIAMVLSLLASVECAYAAKLVVLNPQPTVSCQFLGVTDSASNLGVAECEYECLCGNNTSLLYYVVSGGSCNSTIQISSGQCPAAGN